MKFFRLNDSLNEKIGLEEDTIRIRFDNNKHTSNFIDIWLNHGRKSVQIRSGDGALIIQPVVSNVVEIKKIKHG